MAEPLWMRGVPTVGLRSQIGAMYRDLFRSIYGPGPLVDHRGRPFPGQKRSTAGLAELVGLDAPVKFPVDLKIG